MVSISNTPQQASSKKDAIEDFQSLPKALKTIELRSFKPSVLQTEPEVPEKVKQR